ncbi:MAG TPA: UDP-glucose 6-dehydrogenase, partial [Corynebacterium pollutisoli]|nr:UDP-glucose 6-dehydrogenase [Corynebacterium pollutisoli]
PTLGYVDSIEEALEGADVVVLATEWQQFRDLDPQAAGELVNKKIIIDGRNVLDVDKWQGAGWDIHALGRTL